METTLGAYIRKIREDNGWDQADVGARIGRPKSWISNLETGKKQHLPEPHELRELARALGVSAFDLLRAAGYVEESEVTADSGIPSEIRDLLPAIREVRWNPERVGALRANLRNYLSFDRLREAHETGEGHRSPSR